MYEEPKPGMQCLEFDALLSDAIDGSLSGTVLARFEAHRTSCPSCGPMFVEARTGMQLLSSLAEVEPPANFVHNVLAATTGRTETMTQAAGPRESWWEKLRGALRPALGPVRQPKFAMAFAMAFFSISLVLNLAGFKISNLRRIDLRPNAIVRGAYEAQGRVVKYYENIRFVYEIESRVQELKRATTPEETTPPAEKHKDRKDQSGNPDQKQNQNYSREQEAVTVARRFEAAPATPASARSALAGDPGALAGQVFARRNS
jgi:hypothetical protein